MMDLELSAVVDDIRDRLRLLEQSMAQTQELIETTRSTIARLRAATSESWPRPLHREHSQSLLGIGE